MPNPDVRTPRISFTIAAIAWALAVVIQSLHAGVFNGLTNPFEWWLSFFEAIEFLLWVPSSAGNLGIFLSNLGGSESMAILAGLAGIVAWITMFVALVKLRRNGTSTRFIAAAGILNFLFQPLFAWGIIGYQLRADRAEN